ncbi:MAG: response regulator [Ruthenibacterium sp.]
MGIRIFLVEDEIIALQALKQKIEDLQGDYEVLGTATNGLEAYGRILEARPDVLITDIRMPDMDGITLLEKLRAAGNTALPVIVSGYQEFAYAQRAIRLGVQEYLLKPVELSALQKCLQSCSQVLAKATAPQNVASLILGIDNFLPEGQIGTEPCGIIYLIFSNALGGPEYILHPSVPYVSSAELVDFFRIHSGYARDILCFDGFFSNEKAVILSGCTQDAHDLRATAQALAEPLAKSYGWPVTACCAIAEGNSLTSRLRACRKAAAQGIVLGKTAVCEVGQSLTDKCDVNLKETAQMLLSLLRQGETTLLGSNLHKLTQSWQAAERPLLYVRQDLVFLLSTVRHGLATGGHAAADSEFLLENLLCFSDSYEELGENFYLLLTELFLPAEHNHLRSESKKVIVRQIEQYFQQNLSEPITLQMLSDKMNLSKVYLCRIFKQKKNMTPIDYFTHLKIEKAQKMLRQMPGTPLREAAEALGFSDVSYFSKVFKRIVGETPSEFANGTD